jgi:hypothetical protein
MAPAFLFKLGAQDLSQYVRVSPQDSMDPYGGGDWADPQFSDAPFAEGRPLLNIDTNNREMVWPLFLKGVGSAGSGAGTGTNLSTNPSFETDTANWSTSGGTILNAGATLTRITTDNATDPNAGVACGQVAGTVSNTGVRQTVSGLTVGHSYSVSVWIKLVSGTSNLVLSMGPLGSNTTASITPTGTWTRYSLTRVAAATSEDITIYLASNAATTFNMDAVLVIDGSIVSYFDGNTGGWQWSGTTNDSTSIPAAGTPAVAAKDNLHTVVQNIVREINNPTSSPLRVEWKDQGASNSTFYDVTYARWDPHFNYRLSEHAYADGAVRVWCQPPYGHTATERVIATAAGTAPGLIASLIGVASPLVGDVAPQLRVTVNTSGEPVGPAGRGVIIAAPQASGYIPFISAASFVSVHPSAGIFGASGAPGSQALYRPPGGDSGYVARVGLGATMYASRRRIYAAVLPTRWGTGQVAWAADQANVSLGPTAVTRRADGWQLLDLGVVDVPTSTPTTTLSLNLGDVFTTALDTSLQRPLPTGAAASSNMALAGIYVLPENYTQAAVDSIARPLARSFFGASGAATQLFPDQFVGDLAETYNPALALPSCFFNISGAYMRSPTGGIGAYLQSRYVVDWRMRHVSQLATASSANPPGVSFGVSGRTANDLVKAVLGGPATGGSAGLLLANIRVKTTNAATILVASQAGLTPDNPIVADLFKQDNTVTLNLRYANASGIGIIVAGVATVVPIACVSYAGTGLERVTGGPYFDSSSGSVSVYQFHADELVGPKPQPSDAYRLTNVAQDTPLRSPISGSGPNANLAAAVRGPIPSITASQTGVVAVDWQLDGGPMNDPMGVEVRVRERWSYAR